MLIGVVGKPNTGKSSFFSAATLVDAQIGNRPFVTIDSNKGMGFVRVECVEKEFNVKCNPRTGTCNNGTRFVPVELVDVAGLVPGAHQGKGLGNRFLSDLSTANVLIHVVDASGSTNEQGETVQAGSHDPIQDVLFLETELDEWFFGILEKNWGKFAKQPLTGKQKMIEVLSQNLSGMGVKEKHIDMALTKLKIYEKKFTEWSTEEKKEFSTLLREFSKPTVIAANKMDIDPAKENLKKIKERFPDKTIIPCVAVAELALRKAAKEGFIEYFPGEKSFSEKKDLNEKQKKGMDWIKENVLEKFETTGVQEVLDKTVFDSLKYIAVFPAGINKLADKDGNILADCFLVPPNSTALDFAFKLHTDIGNGFIKAINVKKKIAVGKDYLLQHRDAIEIVFKK